MACGLFSSSANVACFSCFYKTKMVNAKDLEINGKRQVFIYTVTKPSLTNWIAHCDFYS